MGPGQGLTPEKKPDAKDLHKYPNLVCFLPNAVCFWTLDMFFL
jgi:hypothetical protein